MLRYAVRWSASHWQHGACFAQPRPWRIATLSRFAFRRPGHRLVRGGRAALVAVAGGIFLADYFVIRPLCSFGFKGATQYIDLAFYLVVGTGIAVLGGIMHAAHLANIRKFQQVRKDLAQSEERLRFTLRSSGLAVWTSNLAENKVESDENYAILFGLPVGQFPQTDEGFAACLHPDDRERVQAELAASIEHATEYNTEFRGVWPEGTMEVRRPNQQCQEMHSSLQLLSTVPLPHGRHFDAYVTHLP
jgi:PAS domain-containing protein